MTLPSKTAVVLFNLGGPDGLAAVRPFLQNLFKDPAIIQLPAFLRKPLAWWIAKRRCVTAREIYQALGGSSPLLQNTQAQAQALEATLQGSLSEVRVFVAMRYWHPFAQEALDQVLDFKPDHIVLLPLYPQFSTTTTGSSFEEWDALVAQGNRQVPTTRICCYPSQQGFVGALAAPLREATQGLEPDSFRVLFSAHGLPQKIVDKGDPYALQVARSARAVAQGAGLSESQWRLCYQSRVGPLKWLEPNLHDELERAAQEGKGVILVPIAFVSEHSETLYELDIEYAALGQALKLPFYRRISTPQAHPTFIQGLAELVLGALKEAPQVNILGEQGACPRSCGVCPRQKGTCS